MLSQRSQILAYRFDCFVLHLNIVGKNYTSYFSGPKYIFHFLKHHLNLCIILTKFQLFWDWPFWIRLISFQVFAFLTFPICVFAAQFLRMDVYLLHFSAKSSNFFSLRIFTQKGWQPGSLATVFSDYASQALSFIFGSNPSIIKKRGKMCQK